MTSTLLISTYNRPGALAAVFFSVLRQTVMPDEIVVCDDGSGPATKELIEKWRKLLPVPLLHIWQPDDGFRLAEIRNKGVAASSGDYIIQIDGDIILERHFVEDHLRMAKPGYYIKGSRVRLTPSGSEEICRTGEAGTIRLWSRKIMKDRLKSFRAATIGRLISLRYKNKGTAIGCNTSYWREDFIRVNGYDENFVGWGCEDIDLNLRFGLAGVKTFKLFRMGLCWHLWHKESTNPHLDEAYKRMNDRYSRGEVRSPKGIDRYLPKP